MDDIKPNQSLDGMQGGKGPQPGGFQDNTGVSSDANNSGGLNQFNDADYAPDASGEQHINFEDQQHQEPVQPSGGSGKGLKILLTLFVILFIAASAAAGYFYMQSNKEEPKAAVVDVSKVTQENEALTYDNKTLKTQNTQYQVQIKSLTTTANQLKTKCGSGCSAIVIPQ